MKKILARCLMLATLSMCLVGLGSTDISARPPGPICQPWCVGGLQCQTVWNGNTQRCESNGNCSIALYCIGEYFTGPFEEAETGPELIIYP